MLRLNGLTVGADNEGAVAAALYLARKEWTLDQFAEWLEAHAVPNA